MNDNATEEITQDVELDYREGRATSPPPGNMTVNCPYCDQFHAIWVSPRNKDQIVDAPCKGGKIKIVY